MTGRQAWFIAVRDLRHLFREWETWVWAFLMPPLFMFFIGAATARRPAVAQEIVALYAPSDSGFLAEALVHRLERQGFHVVRTDGDGLARYRRRLAVPAGFTEQALAGQPVAVEFEHSGGGLASAYDTLRMQKAVYALLADLLLLRVQGRAPGAAALEELASAPRTLAVEAVPASPPRTVPSGYQHAVPGMLVMFVLLSMLTTGGVSLLEERRQGLLRRLAAAPLTRASIMAGKWGSRLALGCIQIAWVMVLGTLLFRVDWGGAPWAVAVVLLLYGALCSLAGMLLGNEGRSPGAVVGAGVLLTNGLAALGGCWWPVEITPPWAQKLALLLPTGWAMDALHLLMSFGRPPAGVLAHLAALALAALACGWLLARRFRFD